MAAGEDELLKVAHVEDAFEPESRCEGQGLARTWEERWC